MKIIQVVVDRLPESAQVCRFNVEINETFGTTWSNCWLTGIDKRVSTCDYVTQRCPNCPLVEEAEEVQE